MRGSVGQRDAIFAIVDATQLDNISGAHDAGAMNPKKLRRVQLLFEHVERLAHQVHAVAHVQLGVGSTIRVGISEIGYAFPAPTGIVDYDLRRATNGVPTATIIADAGPFAIRSVSADGSVPLMSKQLQLPIGASYQVGGPIPSGANLGYIATIINAGAAPQWQPNDRVIVRAFVDWQRTTHSQTLPYVYTAGGFLPPRIDRGYFGQN